VFSLRELQLARALLLQLILPQEESSNMSTTIPKKILAATLTCAALSASFSAPSASAQENCVGESKEGPSHNEPLGPGNSYRKVKVVYLNSCEAKALHDEVASGKDGDALVAALIGLIPEAGPALAVAHVLGSRFNAAFVTSQLEDASNNFTNGVKVFMTGSQFDAAYPQ